MVAVELWSMYVSNGFEHVLNITAFQSCGIYIDYSVYCWPIKLLCWPLQSLSLAREAVKTLIFSIHLYALHY